MATANSGPALNISNTAASWQHFNNELITANIVVYNYLSHKSRIVSELATDRLSDYAVLHVIDCAPLSLQCAVKIRAINGRMNDDRRAARLGATLPDRAASRAAHAASLYGPLISRLQPLRVPYGTNGIGPCVRACRPFARQTGERQVPEKERERSSLEA